MNEDENPRCVHVTSRIPVCSKSGLLKRKDGDHLGINGVVDLSRSRRSRSLSFKMVIVSLKSEGCCHAVTLISESSSTFSYTDSHVFCCSFHFPLRKILENYEGVKSAFSVRF